METRLTHARRQITIELNGRTLAERQRDALEAQLDQIRILVAADEEEIEGVGEGVGEGRFSRSNSTTTTTQDRQSILKNLLVQKNNKYDDCSRRIGLEIRGRCVFTIAISRLGFEVRVVASFSALFMSLHGFSFLKF